MRRILSAVLVLGAIFVSVMASGKITETNTTKNRVLVHGLYVALSNDMKTFPAELALIAQRGL